MKLKAQKQNAKRGAAQRRESGFQVAKMTRATANQPMDSMLLLVAQSPPLKSKTYIMPPKPAKPQPMMVAMYLYLVTLIPAESAVAGFSPTALKFNPVLVLNKKIEAKIHKRMVT